MTVTSATTTTLSVVSASCLSAGVPEQEPQHLYLGIDVGKKQHAVALYRPFQEKEKVKKPVLPRIVHIPNTRSGFDTLLSHIKGYRIPLERCHVLTESTGHYGAALEGFLHEQHVLLYRINANHKRFNPAVKSDQSDARALAMHVYNQIGLHAIVNADDRVRPLVPPCDIARELRPLVQTRYELAASIASYENRLTALSDEIFPEMSQVWKKTYGPSLWFLREQFPTPESVVAVSLDALCAARTKKHPGRGDLEKLQALAAHSIGTKDEQRRRSLLLEQEMLMRHLQASVQDQAILTSKIESLVPASREGQILCSISGISPLQAGEFLAFVGNIRNFDTCGKLRRYCGWAPQQSQTGTSYDHTALQRSGNRILKRGIFLTTLRLVKTTEPWCSLHARLVPRLCIWDMQKKKYKGKMRVIGRIAGQLIRVIYTLLKKDALRVDVAREKGEALPSPILYDASKHSIHR